MVAGGCLLLIDRRKRERECLFGNIQYKLYNLHILFQSLFFRRTLPFSRTSLVPALFDPAVQNGAHDNGQTEEDPERSPREERLDGRVVMVVGVVRRILFVPQKYARVFIRPRMLVILVSPVHESSLAMERHGEGRFIDVEQVDD